MRKLCPICHGTGSDMFSSDSTSSGECYHCKGRGTIVICDHCGAEVNDDFVKSNKV